MLMKTVNLVTLDERAAFQNRCSALEKWINEFDGNSGIPPDEDVNDVSILNLPSLKRGRMTSKLTPSAKLKLILADKKRLSGWITNYKVRLERTLKHDPVQIATFREAATRLKMLLDHSDFDEGDLRNERRIAISEINDLISGF